MALSTSSRLPSLFLRILPLRDSFRPFKKVMASPFWILPLLSSTFFLPVLIHSKTSFLVRKAGILVSPFVWQLRFLNLVSFSLVKITNLLFFSVAGGERRVPLGSLQFAGK